MSSKIEQLIKAAIAAANRSDSPNFKLGAAAYRNGRIIATGTNEYIKTSPNTTNRSRKIHAEFALSKTNLWGSTVLVVRLTGGGKMKLAKPCEHCEKYLVDCRQVLWSDNESRIVTSRGLILGTVVIEPQLSQFIPQVYV